MHKYKLVLRHPLFGFKVLEYGAFDRERARVLGTKSVGTGYQLVSCEKIKP